MAVLNTDLTENGFRSLPGVITIVKLDRTRLWKLPAILAPSMHNFVLQLSLLPSYFLPEVVSPDVCFIRSLQDPLTPDHMVAMNGVYKFSQSHNSEIAFRWLSLGIRAKYEASIDPALEMVTIQGRMKFTRPLYRCKSIFLHLSTLQPLASVARTPGSVLVKVPTNEYSRLGSNTCCVQLLLTSIWESRIRFF